MPESQVLTEQGILSDQGTFETSARMLTSKALNMAGIEYRASENCQIPDHVSQFAKQNFVRAFALLGMNNRGVSSLGCPAEVRENFRVVLLNWEEAILCRKSPTVQLNTTSVNDEDQIEARQTPNRPSKTRFCRSSTSNTGISHLISLSARSS
jgi:hypothetical protein